MDHDTIRNKLKAVSAELKTLFFQREREIEGLILASLAREHVLLLGPPGTAKSELTRAFTARLAGATYFDWLLSKFTQPEELFGPVSISGLKNDTFRRVTGGKLPEAHVGFLDEIFKANSAVLNALLTVANERRFHNGTTVMDTPTRILVGASNELPSDESLAAFYDRFLVRFWVEPIAGQSDWKELMNRTNGAWPNPTTITFEEWDYASDAAAQIPIGHTVMNAAFLMKKKLETEGVTSSDRRWVKAFKLARAAAYMDGEDEVMEENCAVWAHVLWNEPSEQARVLELVTAMASAELVKVREVYDAISSKLNEVEPLQGDEFENRAAGTNTDARRALKQIDTLYKQCRSKGSKKRIAKMGRELKGRTKAIRERLLKADEVQQVGF